MANITDKTVKSKYPPKDTNVTWIDTSSKPYVSRSYINGSWEVVGGGVTDYNDIKNKPTINGVELDGNKTSQDLGVYSKPSSGIPQSDLSSDVQSQLNKHFKGWYNTLEELKATHTAVDGDSAYVKDASPATTWSIYVYDSTASSDNYWADSGTDADTSNVQTFASSQEVNEVHIVQNFGGGINDVANAEIVKVLNEQLLAPTDLYPLLQSNLIYGTDGAVGSVVSLTPSANIGWNSGVFDCSQYDIFYLKATGGSSARLWCFIDSENKIISNCKSSGSYDVTLLVPTNAVKLIVNINTSATPHIFQKYVYKELINEWGTTPSESKYPSEKLTKETIDKINKIIGEEVDVVQYISNASDIVTFPYIAKAGDVLHIEVSASGVISTDPTDGYEPLYVNSSSNYIGEVWDGASKDFILPVDCVSLKIHGRTPAFIAEGNITFIITNKSAILGRIEKLERYVSTPEIILPNKLTAIVGHQYNIYFDSVLLALNNDNYQKQWSGTIPANNKALACGLRFTPSAVASPANIALTLKDKVTGEQVVKKIVSLKVIADSEITNKKVIFIGDSLTDAGYYPAEIQHNLSNGGIISLGTRSDTVTINGQSLTTNNEGRSGWSPQNYVNNQTFGGLNNAFWNPSTSKFDFSYYMAQQGYDSVDVVCLCLGTNGYNELEDAISALDEMIASIHEYNSNIIVLVTMITPPAYQDGVGYSNGYTSSDGMFRGMMNYNKRVLQEYGDRNDNVDIIPWYINLNRKYDFPTQEEQFSARNPEMVIRQKDNVHPTVYGYLGMADVMYCVLLEKLSN